MAHTRHSRTDSGLGIQAKACRTFRVVLFLLGIGTREALNRANAAGTRLSIFGSDWLVSW